MPQLFYNEENKWVQKHIFTYFLSISSIQKSVALLEKCAVVIQNFYNGNISNEDTENKIGRVSCNCFGVRKK